MGQREEVQGRKTDVKDAEWICEVSRHGLVYASFLYLRLVDTSVDFVYNLVV